MMTLDSAIGWGFIIVIIFLGLYGLIMLRSLLNGRNKKAQVEDDPDHFIDAHGQHRLVRGYHQKVQYMYRTHEDPDGTVHYKGGQVIDRDVVRRR